MSKLDKMISEALDDEDREILEKIGWEQSSLEMAGDLFKGKMGFINWSLIVGQLVCFGIGLYAAWKAFALTDVIEVIRWGLVSLFFMTSAVVGKVGLLPSFQANRTLRALKRLEMQIALLAAKR